MTTTAQNEVWAILPDALQARVDAEAQAAAGGKQIQIRTETDPGQKPKYFVESGIAVVSLSGVLVHSSPWPWDLTYQEAAARIRAAAADPAADAVLVRVNSPGGTVAGVTTLIDAVAEAKSRKPIFAHAESVIASGAYWPFSGATAIGADRTAQVGSIGVLTAHTDISKALSNRGVKITFITSGSYKALGNFAEPLETKGRDYIQNRIDSIYSLFLGDVAAGRGLSVSTADQWADGRVFPAAAAHEAGLIDQVGSLAGFVQFIKTTGGKNPMTARTTNTAAAARFEARVKAIAEERQISKSAAMLTARAEDPGAFAEWLESKQPEPAARAPQVGDAFPWRPPASEPHPTGAHATGPDRAAAYEQLVANLMHYQKMSKAQALFAAAKQDPAGNRAWLASQQKEV